MSMMLFNPEPFYPALALIRMPRYPQAEAEKPGPKDFFGTGFFVTMDGVLLTVAHNLTENGEPDGKHLPWVWVCCYDPETHDWTDIHRVNVEPNLIEPVLDVAILLVEAGALAPLTLVSKWQPGDNVVMLGFQPESGKSSGYTVRHLLCEIPTNWDVAPYDLRDVHGEPTLRLGMIDRGQQPLGKGISGSPVLNCKCYGEPAIAIEKAIDWPDPSELRPPEVKATALYWLREMFEKLPADQRPELPPTGTSKRKRIADVPLFFFPSFALIIILCALFLYLHLKARNEPFPSEITGILVATFVDDNSKVSDYGKKIAATIEGMLGHHLEERKLQIKICRALTTPSQARQEGTKWNATLVIWGKAIYAELEEKKLIYPTITVVAAEARKYLPTPDVHLYSSISALKDIELDSQLAREPKQLMYFTLGLLDYHQGKYQSAAPTFTRAISETVKQDKNISAIYFYRGNSFLAKGDYPNAIADYQSAIDTNPESAESHNNLGCAYNSVGQYDEAITVLGEAIRLTPDLAMGYINLSSALNNTEQYSAAISLLEKALELNSDIAIAHNNLGVAYRNTGEYDKAAVALKRAIELEPNLAIAYLNLGNVYANQELFDDAIEEFKKAIQLDDKLAEVYSNLGLIYRVREQYAEAIDSLKKAVELAPSLMDPHCNLGDAYYLNKQYSNY